MTSFIPRPLHVCTKNVFFFFSLPFVILCHPTSGNNSTPTPSSPSVNERLNNNKNIAATNQTLKQRISSLVMKAITENDKHFAHQHQSGTSSNPTSPPNSIGNHFHGDAWKLKVLNHTKVIANVKESLFVTEALMKGAQLDQQVIVSMDCEGINLGVRGQLTLLELGTVRSEAFIFDLLLCPEIVNDGGLKRLLESDAVIKVIHDCRNDSVNLYNQFGVKLRNVFDTQSAHAVLQFQDQHKPVYKVKNVSLNSLCEYYRVPINPMKDQLKNIYRRDQKYWSRRPLTKDMLLYAAGDVLVLINDQLYGTMSK